MAYLNSVQPSDRSTALNPHTLHPEARQNIASAIEHTVHALAQNLFVNSATNVSTSNFCRQMVESYLKENPGHQDINQLTYQNLNGVLHIKFYNLVCKVVPDKATYKAEQWVAELQSKAPLLDAECCSNSSIENRYAYIPESGRVSQVWHKTTDRDGTVTIRNYEYIPELSTMQLVKQTIEKIGKTPQLDVWKFDPITKNMLKLCYEQRQFRGKLEVGFFQTVPELQLECRYLMYGKREVTNQAGARDLYEGKFDYVPGPSKERNCTFLVHGKIYLLEQDLKAVGHFAFYEAIQKMRLCNGKLSKSTCVDDGQWAYVQELDNVVLINGTRTYPDGRVETGGRAYISELGRMELVHGEKEYGNGTRTMPAYSQGRFDYIPELRQMRLVDGKEVFDGMTLEGQWIYSAKKHDMVIANFTDSNKEALQGLVKSLEMVARNLDLQAETRPELNLLRQMVAFTLQARTLEDVHQGLDQIGAQIQLLVRQLIPFCHMGKSFVSPTYKEAYIGLMKLKNDIGSILDLVK